MEVMKIDQVLKDAHCLILWMERRLPKTYQEYIHTEMFDTLSDIESILGDNSEN